MAITYNLAADGSTAAVFLKGDITVDASGSFGSGTLALEFSINGTTNWYTPTDDAGVAVELTVPDSVGFRHAGIYVRTTLTGSTAPDIDIQFGGVRNTSKT